MHDIEPHFRWREEYCAEDDERSPFYGEIYNELGFSTKVYNYFIHPQWDKFGSDNLYLKILFIDYEDAYCIIEMIGEWNDCLYNDVMFLKRNIIEHLTGEGINKFIIIGEAMLNFHGSDDCYYEEWHEEVGEEGGWIVFVNFSDVVVNEMESFSIHHYINMGDDFNDVIWRPYKPIHLFQQITLRVQNNRKGIFY